MHTFPFALHLNHHHQRMQSTSNLSVSTIVFWILIICIEQICPRILFYLVQGTYYIDYYLHSSQKHLWWSFLAQILDVVWLTILYEYQHKINNSYSIVWKLLVVHWMNFIQIHLIERNISIFRNYLRNLTYFISMCLICIGLFIVIINKYIFCSFEHNIWIIKYGYNV